MKAWNGFALAVAASALLAGRPSDARGQEAGDRVIITLSSGKKFTGTLVSKSEGEVVLRIGDSPISLPGTMVASMQKEPVPAAAKATAAAPAPAPAPAADAPGEEPRPATVLLKDGSTVEGFLLKKGDDRIWIVPGKAVTVPTKDVDEVFGEFPEEGGLAISGDAARDSMRLVKDLGSPDPAKSKAASAALEAYGDGALPALIKGLRNENSTVRNMCLGNLAARGVEAGLDGMMDLMRTDPVMGLRAAAAEALVNFNRPIVRRALLEAAWRDRDERVKAAAIRSLVRIATVEEAPALIDLLNILPEGAESKSVVYEALRTATGEKMASDAPLWIEWWESKGGKESVGARIQEAIQKRIEDEEKRAMER